MIAGTSTCHMALSAEPRAGAGRLGAVSRRGAARAVAERGRAVGDRARCSTMCVQLHGAGGEPLPATCTRRWWRASPSCARPRVAAFAARPARAARLPRQPLAAGRSARDRRDQRADARQLGFDCAGAALLPRPRSAIALGHAPHPGGAERQGLAIDTLHVAGGHAKNPLLMELYADATGCRVVEPAARTRCCSAPP